MTITLGASPAEQALYPLSDGPREDCSALSQ